METLWQLLARWLPGLGADSSSLERETPAPFPRWLMRLDPTLARWEENPVTVAFVRRRRFHRTRLRQRGGEQMHSIDSARDKTLFELGWIAFCAATMMVGYFLTIYALTMLHQRRFTRQPTMPGSISAVLGMQGTMATPAIDLWMAGVGGRHIAEALMHEHRRLLLRGALFGIPLVLLLVFGIDAWNNGLTWGDVPMRLGYLVLFAVGAFIHATASAGGHASAMVAVRAISWETRGWTRTFLRLLRWWLPGFARSIGVGLIFLGAMAVGPALLYAAELRATPDITQPLVTAGARGLIDRMLVGAGLGHLLMALVLFRSTLRRSTRLVEHWIDRATPAWDMWIERILEKMEEGENQPRA